jgi:hypothetical protein
MKTTDEGLPKIYARHYALYLIKLHNSKSKAIAEAKQGLREANNYNEECYWNRVIREFNVLD